MIDELLSGIDYLLQVNTEKLNNAISFKEGILKNKTWGKAWSSYL